jgi:hypothetical protein
MVYVKIQGTDCQVREVVLEAGMEKEAQPAEPLPGAAATDPPQTLKRALAFQDQTAALGLKRGTDAACWKSSSEPPPDGCP